MEVKEIKKKVEKTFCADNGKRFSVGTDISFVLADTGDKCIGTIRKIKKKCIIIDSIEINGKPLPIDAIATCKFFLYYTQVLDNLFECFTINNNGFR